MRDDTAGWRWLLFVLVSPQVSRLGDGRGASFLWPVAAAGRRAGAPNFEVASAVAWQSEAYWGRWQCWSRRGSELRRVGRSWTPLSRVGGCARWWTGRGCWDAETRGSAIDSAICVCRRSVLGRCVLCGCKRGHVAGGSPHHHGRGWWEGDSADQGAWASGMHKQGELRIHVRFRGELRGSASEEGFEAGFSSKRRLLIGGRPVCVTCRGGRCLCVHRAVFFVGLCALTHSWEPWASEGECSQVQEGYNRRSVGYLYICIGLKLICLRRRM